MGREEINMIATAWNNGKKSPTGGGYGLKIKVKDRDRVFDRKWKTVILCLTAYKSCRVAEVNVSKASFWDATCLELISTEIGKWFIECGFAPWTKGAPPKFQLKYIGERKFQVELNLD
ncbi:MAG: hypothetical protein OXC05_08380 [Halieaceae bacterium]|nr:hypothetical protein [Halieaceae bacterium]